MGAACSTATKDGDGEPRTPTAGRMSFSSVRLGKPAQLLKAGGEYTELYTIGDVVGSRDDLVVSAVKVENEVEYVSRAIEKADMPVQDLNGVRDHLSSLASLDHLHLCRFLEAFDCNERVQMIYEKCKPVSIFEEEERLKKGKPLGQELVQMFCRQMVSALRIAHKSGIVHGRLSDSCLCLDLNSGSSDDDKSLKICDIGQTFIMRPVRNNQRVDYECPDVLWEELQAPASLSVFRTNIRAYQAADMWSVGVLLYKMLTGKMPFAAPDHKQLAENIRVQVVEFGPEWAKMPDAREVVQGLLKNSWRIRFTAEKLLKHPWILLSKARLRKSKMMRVLQNVLINANESTFKKFTLRVMSEELTPEKLAIVQNAFSNLDRNGDGTLEVEEIRAALKKFGEEEDAADGIFDAIDRDASGTLNFAEFTAVSIGRQEYTDKEVLFHAFNRFDRDGNGEFDKTEICRVLKEVEHTTETAALESEVDEIARDIQMPMDFHTFVQNMVTPAGEDVSNFSVSWNRFCSNICKVDMHGIKAFERRDYTSEAPQANVLFKPIYKASNYSVGNGETPKARKGKK